MYYVFPVFASLALRRRKQDAPPRETAHEPPSAATKDSAQAEPAAPPLRSTQDVSLAEREPV